MGQKQLYIYGIIPNDYAPDLFVELDEIGVYSIPFRNVSAIVTDRNAVKLDQMDKESLSRLLVNHQKSIERIMNIGFSEIIPVRIGTFADSRDEVREILEKGYGLINNVIEKIRNLIEVDIVSTWANFPDVLKDIAGDPVILELRKDLQKKGKNVTQSDHLKLGVQVKEILSGKNRDRAERVKNVLESFSRDAKHHDVINDEMLTSGAFLIDRDEQESFDNALETLDAELNGELNFKYVGPLPCYSFYTLEIKELIFDQVERAKNELGLDKLASKDQIKQAYLGKANIYHPDKNTDIANTVNFDRIKKAYETLLDYSSAASQISPIDQLCFEEETVRENSLLVKILD